MNIAASPILVPVLVSRDHPARAQVEALIASVYAHQYNAKVSVFADVLLALPDGNGGISAAAGRRSGADSCSDTYPDQPIQKPLSTRWPPTATRDGITEVTTQSPAHPNASHALSRAITGHLRA